MQTELIQLGIAVILIVFVLFLLRRAGAKSRASSPAAVQQRLGYEAEAAAPPKRKRPIREPKPVEQPAEAEAQPEAEVPVDEETAAAYKAGLAKTRGGFVAKLGKLFGKKQIDAQTVDELEE